MFPGYLQPAREDPLLKNARPACNGTYAFIDIMQPGLLWLDNPACTLVHSLWNEIHLAGVSLNAAAPSSTYIVVFVRSNSGSLKAHSNLCRPFCAHTLNFSVVVSMYCHFTFCDSFVSLLYT